MYKLLCIKETSMRKDKKEKILSKVRKQQGLQICISGELVPEEFNLTIGEYQELISDIYKNELKELNPDLAQLGFHNAFADHIVRSGMVLGEIEPDPKKLLDGTQHYPFLDKDHGLILAKAEDIQKAIISYIDYNKPLASRLYAFLNHLNPDLKINPINSETIAQHIKNRVENISKENYQSLKKYSIDELKKFLEQPLVAKGSKIESVVTPFDKRENDELKEEILATFFFRVNMFIIQMKIGEHCNSRRLTHLEKLVREIQNTICNSLTWFLPHCYKMLEHYLQILKQSIDATSINPIKAQHSRFIKLYRKQMNTNELAYEASVAFKFEDEDNDAHLYSGLSKSSIAKIKDLQKLEKLITSNKSSISDYSLLTFGYIAILEKELNDIVEFLKGKRSNSSLHKIFEYFKELKDYSTLDRIYPILNLLRFTIDKNLHNMIRRTRNNIAHGNETSISAKEHKAFKDICFGNEDEPHLSFFQAVSATKLLAGNQILDTNLVSEKILDKFESNIEAPSLSKAL